MQIHVYIYMYPVYGISELWPYEASKWRLLAATSRRVSKYWVILGLGLGFTVFFDV